MVYNVLEEKGINAELYSEGNLNHPADFDGVAYFSSEEFTSLQENHSKSSDKLDKIKIQFHNGFLIPFRKAMEEDNISFDDELLRDITKNDVYELPIDIHIELLVNSWDNFVNNYINKDKVVIFECCFIQNPVTVSMIRNNSSRKVTMNYINRLAEKIIPLEPILIYVNQEDIKASFTKVIGERPKEWFEGFKYYYTNYGYGLANNLKDLDGVIGVLEERSKLESEIYDSLNMIKYKVNNSALDRNLLTDNIESIIESHFNLGYV